MPVEKLIEFATTGAKNTTGLDLEEGFPSNVKPARQWVNWLFNSLCVKINEMIDQLETPTNKVTPGLIMMWTKTAAPDGYLECAGQAVSRTTYADLFDVLGVAFGDGDGTTTFNLPDLRGEFVRGWDNGRGVDAGRYIGSEQADQMQRITGSYMPYHNSYGASVSGAFTHEGDTYGGTGVDYVAGKALKFDSYFSPGARVGDETRPRNLALMYVIKT